MIKFVKEYRFYITLFLFVLIPILAIDTATRAPRNYSMPDRIIVTLTAPFQILITGILDWTVDTTQDYLFLFQTRKENARLRAENQELLNSVLNLRETLGENERLRRLLDFKETFRLKTVVARVIAKDVSTEHRAIRINRGSAHGIQPNMGVLNAEGIVGRVLRVTEHSADIMTVLDVLSSIDVLDQRSRVRGILEGRTDELARLKFALRTDDIQEGDTLLSSGLGGIFPKGVPAGTVSSVNRKRYGITQEVSVRPSVTFSTLEEVFVITEAGTVPLHATDGVQERVRSLPARKPL